MTICDIYDHLRPPATNCDYLRPFATFATICDLLPAFTTKCDHFFTICDQLRHLPQFATNCDLLRPFLTICDQLRPCATTFDYLRHLRPFVTIFWPFTTNCDHLQHLRHLRPFALQCDCHWAYKIRIYHYSSLGLFSKFRTDLGPTCHLDDGSLCHNIFAIIMPISWYCFKISWYCIIGLNINTWYNVMICHYKGMMWHVGLIT